MGTGEIWERTTNKAIMTKRSTTGTIQIFLDFVASFNICPIDSNIDCYLIFVLISEASLPNSIFFFASLITWPARKLITWTFPAL